MTGSGEVWVFTDGKLVRRARGPVPTRALPATYTDAAGKPIKLAPGRTWVELAAFGPETQLVAPPTPAAVAPDRGDVDHQGEAQGEAVAEDSDGTGRVHRSDCGRSAEGRPVDCAMAESAGTAAKPGPPASSGASPRCCGAASSWTSSPPEQAKVAEDAGAVAVMALERVPADIRRDGGVARMSDPAMIEGIQAAVTIPVMAKCRIGHFAEAQVLESLGVDYIDESEVLTPADEANHVDKWAFTVPFVCGATNLGEALRRISEGACMIRSKGEAGTGNIVEAVRHLRSILGEIRRLTVADEAELFAAAKDHRAPVELVREVAALGELPVPMFCAGGIATPADASLVMQLGAQAVFVGSGHLQERRTRDDGEGDRRGDHPLPRRRRSSRRSRRSLGRGDARRGDRHPRREARRTRLVARDPAAARTASR